MRSGKIQKESLSMMGACSSATSMRPNNSLKPTRLAGENAMACRQPCSYRMERPGPSRRAA
jgi:hypothetical protein